MRQQEEKTEFEIYFDEVYKYIETFKGELDDDNRHMIERIVPQMKQRFALDDAQEAAVTIALFDLYMVSGCSVEDYPVKTHACLIAHIITHIVLKKYRDICDDLLTDEGLGIPSRGQEDEPHNLLYNWYCDEIAGIPDGDDEDSERVTIVDVMDFFVLNDGTDIPCDEMMDIMNDFRSRMDALRHDNALVPGEPLTKLLNQTVMKLFKLSEDMEF